MYLFYARIKFDSFPDILQRAKGERYETYDQGTAGVGTAL